MTALALLGVDCPASPRPPVDQRDSMPRGNAHWFDCDKPLRSFHDSSTAPIAS
jgi:hypothetical protein